MPMVMTPQQPQLVPVHRPPPLVPVASDTPPPEHEYTPSSEDLTPNPVSLNPFASEYVPSENSPPRPYRRDLPPVRRELPRVVRKIPQRSGDDEGQASPRASRTPRRRGTRRRGRRGAVGAPRAAGSGGEAEDDDPADASLASPQQSVDVEVDVARLGSDEVARPPPTTSPSPASSSSGADEPPPTHAWDVPLGGDSMLHDGGASWPCDSDRPHHATEQQQQRQPGEPQLRVETTWLSVGAEPPQTCSSSPLANDVGSPVAGLSGALELDDARNAAIF